MIKIVQGGRESFIPDNQHNRQFWTKQNSKVAGSHNAQEEYVTILQATTEEVAQLEKQNAASLPQKVVAPVPNNELDALKQQVAQMQEVITKLTRIQAPYAAPSQEITAPEEQQKEKAKPGPKPKTDKDGESETKDTAKAQG